MYRYLLFGFSDYYPSGGMEDLRIKFNTYEEFKKNFTFENYYSEWQLVDTENNFSWESLRSSIDIWDDDNEKKRESELVTWIKESI